MEKSTGILLLIAVAFRLLVLFFFSQSIFLTQLSISTFIVVMIIAIILMLRKWLHCRNSKENQLLLSTRLVKKFHSC